MKAGIKSEHWNDENGNPAGGSTFGNGFAISWQNGPLGTGSDRKEPNGAFVEDVLAAVIDRVQFYQDSKFACEENKDTIALLKLAAKRMGDRTKAREERAVEGTHKV